MWPAGHSFRPIKTGRGGGRPHNRFAGRVFLATASAFTPPWRALHGVYRFFVVRLGIGYPVSVCPCPSYLGVPHSEAAWPPPGLPQPSRSRYLSLVPPCIVFLQLDALSWRGQSLTLTSSTSTGDPPPPACHSAASVPIVPSLCCFVLMFFVFMCAGRPCSLPVW